MGEVGRVGSFPESYPVYCEQQRDRIGTSRLKTSVEQRARAVSSPGSCLFTSAYSTNVNTSPKSLCCAEPVQLLVCMWRHGGHVGGQEQKHFSPLGTKLYFHLNSSRKYYFVLTPNMAALSRGCKPRICDSPLSRSARCCFAPDPLQKSRRNHCSYVCEEMPYPAWFSCRHKSCPVYITIIHRSGGG